MMNTFEQLVSAILPLIGVVFGLVEFAKAAFGLQGQAAARVSFAIGALMGALVFVAVQFPQWGAYILGLVFALASGLVASGYYDFVNQRFPRIKGNGFGEGG
jgi:hypothetical protein